MPKRPIRPIGLRTPSKLRLNVTNATGNILRRSCTVGRKEDGMTEKINKLDATLKKLSENTASGRSEPSTEVSEEEYIPSSDLAGDVNCPYCHGLGSLRP